MLKIVKYGEDEYAFPSLLVLGCFDGVHRGHAELLKKAKLQAKINGLDFGVMMFVDGKGGRQLFNFEERLEILREFNVKFVFAVEYTEDFKKTAATEFLQRVEEKVNVKAYMSGKDFRFGAGAKGKASTLKNYAENEENGVWYMPVKDVVCDEGKISATMIKDMLSSGNVVAANALLGRNFFVKGTVTTGAERGAALLGFPTMNIKYPEEKIEVKQGVYRVKCELSGGIYDGIANYGARPTFDEEEPVLEVYLKDFQGDVYGEQVKVEFIDYIRDIRKFDDAEGLSAQLKRDLNILGDDAIESLGEIAEEKQGSEKENNIVVPLSEKCVTEEENPVATGYSSTETVAEVVSDTPGVNEERKRDEGAEEDD